MINLTQVKTLDQESRKRKVARIRVKNPRKRSRTARQELSQEEEIRTRSAVIQVVKVREIALNLEVKKAMTRVAPEIIATSVNRTNLVAMKKRNILNPIQKMTSAATHQRSARKLTNHRRGRRKVNRGDQVSMKKRKILNPIPKMKSAVTHQRSARKLTNHRRGRESSFSRSLRRRTSRRLRRAQKPQRNLPKLKSPKKVTSLIPSQ
jgi:hypothetical protein